jgi:hypothetical protein
MTVVAPQERFGSKEQNLMIPLALRVAEELSRNLGHHQAINPSDG